MSLNPTRVNVFFQLNLLCFVTTFIQVSKARDGGSNPHVNRSYLNAFRHTQKVTLCHKITMISIKIPEILSHQS